PVYRQQIHMKWLLKMAAASNDRSFPSISSVWRLKLISTLTAISTSSPSFVPRVELSLLQRLNCIAGESKRMSMNDANDVDRPVVLYNRLNDNSTGMDGNHSRSEGIRAT